MTHWLSGILFLLFSFPLGAQHTSNPFELTPRMPKDTAAQVETSDEAAVSTTNPFELKTNEPTPVATDELTNTNNPFDLIIAAPKPAPISVPSPRESSKPVLSKKDRTSQGQSPPSSSALLAISLLVLTFAAIALILFRSLYSRAYRSLFNDNLLSQLYREREAGSIGNFIITYLVFFLGGALFLCLLSQHYGWMSSNNLWQQYGFFVLILMAVFIGKHLLLSILGYIFPVRKEIQRYSFTIMVFAIILGLFLSFGSLLLAFTPPNIHVFVIYSLLAVLLLGYVLRSLRGLFLANRFIFNYQFHFLSYICAVEIGPVLCLYKFIIGL